MIQDDSLINEMRIFLKLCVLTIQNEDVERNRQAYMLLHKQYNPLLKIINITDELRVLLLNTDNSPKKRKMFYNDFYKNVKGSSKWIKPFIKGIGLYVDKTVYLKEPEVVR